MNRRTRTDYSTNTLLNYIYESLGTMHEIEGFCPLLSRLLHSLLNLLHANLVHIISASVSILLFQFGSFLDSILPRHHGIRHLLPRCPFWDLLTVLLLKIPHVRNLGKYQELSSSLYRS